jgi:AcrR family transcriptional regulator
VTAIDPGRPVSRQAERSERSAEALLDAAAELVAEVGLVAATFTAIGERAGYSRGLVTARFGSKAGLVDALIRRVWRALRDAGVVPMSQTSPALSSLVGLVDGVHDVVTNNPRDLKAMAALLFEAPGSDLELRARMAAFTEGMRVEIGAVLERGVLDGSIRPEIDPAAEAVTIVAALHGVFYQWLLDPVPTDPDRAYATLRDLVLDRYTPRRR